MLKTLQNRELHPIVGHRKHQQLSLFTRPIYFFFNFVRIVLFFLVLSSEFKQV